MPSLRRILHTLSVRYGLDMIYTYSSNILIAVRTAWHLIYVMARTVESVTRFCSFIPPES